MSGDRVIRFPEVKELTGLGKTTVYRLMDEGLFPQQTKIVGVRAASWLLSDVQKWIAATTSAK